MPRRPSSFVVGCGLIGITAWATDLQAAPRKQVRLSVDGDPCLTEAVVAEAVAERLGYSPFDDRAKNGVRIGSRKSGSSVVATITFFDGDDRPTGTRSIASQSDCGELLQAVAVTLSLSIDPLASPKPSPAKEPPPAAESQRAPVTTEPARDAPPPPPPSPAHDDVTYVPRAGVLAGGDLALSPSITGRAGLHFDLRRERATSGRAVVLGLTVSAFLPTSYESPPWPSYSLRGGDAAIEALFGSRVLFGPIARFGLLSGELERPGDAPSRATSFFAHVGVRAAYEWRPASFFLRVQVDGTVAAIRSVIEIDARDVWTMPYVAAAGAVIAGAVL